MRRILTTVALVAVAGAGTACRRTSPDQSATPTPVTVLEVQNQRFLDMNVYVLAPTSARIRLGTATGNGTTRMVIPSNLIFGTTPLRFVADPIGGRVASVSTSISVLPGDTVTMTIPPG